MRYLLLAILLSFTLNANSQTISIGSENLQLSVGYVDQATQASAGVFKSLQLYKTIHTKIGLSAGIITYDKDTFVRNGNTIRNEGVTESQTSGAIIPSAMIGLEIPVADFKLGLYSGYQSTIWKEVNHRFVPIAVSIGF